MRQVREMTDEKRLAFVEEYRSRGRVIDFPKRSIPLYDIPSTTSWAKAFVRLKFQFGILENPTPLS